MKCWRCEFCKYESGPNKTPKICNSCRHGSNFELKVNMHPIDAIEWKRHLNLDIFIDSFSVEVFDHQRELLHKYCSSLTRRPITCEFPKNHGLTLARSNISKIMDILQPPKEKTFDRDTALMVLKDLSNRMYPYYDLFGKGTLVINRDEFELIRKKYLDGDDQLKKD